MMVIGIIRDEDCYPPAWMPGSLWSSRHRSEPSGRASASLHWAGWHPRRPRPRQPRSWRRCRTCSRRDTRRPIAGAGSSCCRSSASNEFTAPLFLFILAASALVLLLAVINVANLLVARTLDRRHELAVRAMLGASGAQVARIALGEIFVLTAIAIAGGAPPPALSSTNSRQPSRRHCAMVRRLVVLANRRHCGDFRGRGRGAGGLRDLASSSRLSAFVRSATAAAAAGPRDEPPGAAVSLVAGEVGLAAAPALCIGDDRGVQPIAAAFEELAPGAFKFSLTLPESRTRMRCGSANFMTPFSIGLARCQRSRAPPSFETSRPATCRIRSSRFSATIRRRDSRGTCCASTSRSSRPPSSDASPRDPGRSRAQ